MEGFLFPFLPSRQKGGPESNDPGPLTIWCGYFPHYCLFNIISAAITPGTQPQRVRRKVMSTEPHPLSITARGGNRIAKSTLQKLIAYHI